MSSTDGELILAISRGDTEAFNHLYEKYHASIYRFAYYLTQDRNNADDLFQETWLRVVKYLPKTAEIRDFKAWVLCIAINLYRDMLRKQRLRKPFLSVRRVDSEVEDDASNQSQSVVPITTANQDVIEIGPALRRAIAALPLRQRRVFILKEIEGFKHKEIGEMLNLPVGTIKSLLHRAIKRLQKDLVIYRVEG